MEKANSLKSDLDRRYQYCMGFLIIVSRRVVLFTHKSMQDVMRCGHGKYCSPAANSCGAKRLQIAKLSANMGLLDRCHKKSSPVVDSRAADSS